MKKLIYLLVAILCIGIASNEAVAQKKGTKTVCFKSDMDCGSCEKSINEYLKFEKGVKALKVDHASNTIKVVYKEGKNTDEGLAKAIKKKGYKAEKITQKQYDEMMAHVKEHGHEHHHEQHKERN